MDNLGDIRLFVEAAKLGSLSAAGRRMGLSPAASSARLSKLEATLNTRLFQRTTRQLRLTNEGNLYLVHCQQALLALDDGRAALQAGRHGVQGKIRVAATSDFGRHVLKGWLDEFEAVNPDVTVGLTLSDNPSNLLQEDIDIAIRFAALQDSALSARRLASNRRLLCASPAFLIRHGVPKHPSELKSFPCVAMGFSLGESVEWTLSCRAELVTHQFSVSNSMDTNDGALARAWALEGRGIVLKSIWDVGADLAAGRLVNLLSDWRAPDAPVHAIFPRGRYMPARVRSLVDYLVDRFSVASKEILVQLGEQQLSGD